MLDLITTNELKLYPQKLNFSNLTVLIDSKPFLTFHN